MTMRSGSSWAAHPSIVPLVLSAGAVMLVAGFIAFADEMLEGDLSRFDAMFSQPFRTADSTPIGPPWLQEAARDITALGSYACLGLFVLATLGYLLLARRPRAALLVAIAVPGGSLLSTLLKAGFDRPRPEIRHAAQVFTASFPSGHAMLSAITFLTLAALLSRLVVETRLKLYFLLLAVGLTGLVGVSRVYLGVHYPSDVVAGWCMGLAWALLCWSTSLWLERRHDRKTREQQL